MLPRSTQEKQAVSHEAAQWREETGSRRDSKKLGADWQQSSVAELGQDRAELAAVRSIPVLYQTIPACESSRPRICFSLIEMNSHCSQITGKAHGTLGEDVKAKRQKS